MTNVIKLRKLGTAQALASLYEGGAPKGRRECPVKQGTLPQSASLTAPSKRGPRYNCYIS